EELKGRSRHDPKLICLQEDGREFAPDQYPTSISLRTGEPVHNVIMGVPVSPRGGPSQPVTESGRVGRWLLVNSMVLQSTVESGVFHRRRLEGGSASKSRRVVVTFSDITAHRETLEVLRVSEEKYRGLVETLPLAVLQFDRDLRLTYVNPATEACTG